MYDLRKTREIKSKIDDFKEIITDKVENWGSNSMAVFKFIEKKGYDGGYHTVNNFIKDHKKTEINKATIRFDTSPGLQAQVDWKESITMISRQGEIFDINIFLIILGYSRLKFVMLTTVEYSKHYLNSLQRPLSTSMESQKSFSSIICQQL